MREILFRGKRKDNGEWVCGYLWIGANDTFITPYNFGISFDDVKQKISAGAYEVNPETVGQYTGLTDRNGKEIFKGDIVHGTIFSADCKGVIIWIDRIAGFGIKYLHRSDPTAWENSSILKQLMKYHTDEFSAEVIGNIHDNPELLKEADANE